MSDRGREARRNTSTVPDEAIEAAIEWTVKISFNIPDENTHREFEEWLGSDPRHAEAWQQMKYSQEQLDVLPGHQIINVLERVDEKRRSRGISRREAVKWTALGAILLVVGWGIRNQRPEPGETMAADTEAGARHVLRFSEGTVIELNTDTAVRAEFTRRRRNVHLLRGEVFIATGPDSESAASRPFVVETPFGPLQALGTRFAVRLMTGGVRVAVLEGMVRLGTSGTITVAEAGETWILDARGGRRLSDSALTAIDWIDDVIVARNLPLSDLLSELSRYRSEKIVWDPGAADLKVSGIYHTDDTDGALSILSRSLPIVLNSRPDNRIHVSLMKSAK